MTCTKQCRVDKLVSRRGGIGRRARFRSVCRKACGFDSHRRYQIAGMAYRLCTSLPSWLEGFDPPYPLHWWDSRVAKGGRL